VPSKAKTKKFRARQRAVMATRVRRAPGSSTTAVKSPARPIVGIGGSAGGFEAAMDPLRHLPPKSGMAFVIVQHLDPHHAGRLPKLLSKVTPMPVIQIAQAARPQPNTVYIQPPKIDGVVITLGDLESEKESFAGKRRNRTKDISPRK
jgi:two-component system CheB/CheR fusion protein